MNARDILDRYRGDLSVFENIYRHVREFPESLRQEARIASLVSMHLPDFLISSNIGGPGVVAVLRNSKGPTVAIRAVMDDLHLATLLATAHLLCAAGLHWSGTLVCIFQPSDDTGSGAQAMIVDGLWDPLRHAIPIPSIVLGQQIQQMNAGRVALRPGPVFAAVDSWGVRIVGKGGHGARPDRCIDPILTAANIITRLQSVVSRESKPGQLALISCGSIHGGDSPNMIPDHVDLKFTARSCSPEVQDRLLAGIGSIVRGECTASGIEEEPIFTHLGHAPAIVNGPRQYQTLQKSFYEYFEGDLVKGEPSGVSEDFPMLAAACNARYLFWHVRYVEAEDGIKAENEETTMQSPEPGTTEFVVQPTMKTAVDAFALAALTFLEAKM